MAATSIASTPVTQRSVEIDEIDGDDHHSRSVGPLNASQILGSSDESDNDGGAVAGRNVARAALSVIDVNDESDDETDEAQRGTIPHHKSIGNTLMTLDVNIDRLAKDWNAPIYAFFHPIPSIDYVGNPARRVHVFECNTKACNGKGTSRRHVQRYLDTSDGKSTSNLRRHAKICWGEDGVAAVDAAKTHAAAREVVEKSLGMLDKSITAMFERVRGNMQVTYSHRQHTKMEVRYAII
jgi:hypothetical protein